MKNCKSTESFCRSMLASYTNDWSTFWHVYCCFVAVFLNVCKPRTTTYPLWQSGLPGLAFYGSGLACLPGWLGMVNAGWLFSMQSAIFLQMKLIIFQGCPTKLGQPVPYNQLLVQPLSIMKLPWTFWNLFSTR